MQSKGLTGRGDREFCGLWGGGERSTTNGGFSAMIYRR